MNHHIHSDEKIKIIFVVTTVDGYGADKSILNNIIYLKNAGKITPYVIIPKHGKIEEEFKKEKIDYCIRNYNSWTKGYKFSKLPKLKRWMKKTVNFTTAFYTTIANKKFKTYGFVHTNTFTTNYGIYLSRLLNNKHIMHIREIPYEQFRFEYEYPERKVLEFVNKFSSKILCNSQYTYEYFKNKFSPEKLSIVPNPIFTNINVEISNKRSKNLSNKIRFIIAGRYEDSKNQIDVLRAVNELVKQNYTNFKVDLFGSGPLRQSYLIFIEENHLQKYITINDFVENLSQNLFNYDIGIVCSRYEAFGRITIEYLSNGLPVIGNNTGNTPYLITEQMNGLIYEFGNYNDLADKMKCLIDNRSIIQTMSSNAVKMVNDEFSVTNSSLALLKAFNSES